MGSLSSQLVEREIATMKQVEEALSRQVLYGGDLATNLLEVLGGAGEAALTYVIAEHYALRPAKTGELPRASDMVRALVPADTAGRHAFCPLSVEGGSLLVAVAEPLSQEVEDELSFALGMPLSQLAAPLVRIRQALARDYRLPLDRRQLRLIAKLEGFPDPMPSSTPPAPTGGGESFRAPRFPRPFAFDEAARTAAATDKESDRPVDYVPTPARRLIRWMQRTAQVGVTKRLRRRRGPMTIGQAEELLSSVDTAEEALSVFFDFAQQFFTYSALFLVHGDLAEGRDAWGAGASREQVATVGVSLDLPSCLAHARNRLAPVCMTLSKEGMDAALAKDLGRTPTAAIVVVPVVVRRRAVAVVYGDDGDGPVELDEVGDVVAAASLTARRLERLVVLRKRKKDGGEPTRRPTLAGVPAPEPQATPDTVTRERKAEVFARALGIDAEHAGPAVPAPTPRAEPIRRTTAPFVALELGGASPPTPKETADRPAPSDRSPSVTVSTASDEDAFLAAALDELESAPSSEPPPPSSEPPPSEQPITEPAPLPTAPVGSPAIAEMSPNSRSSYHPPRPPPTSQRRQSVLPSIIVDVGEDQARVVDLLIAGDNDEEALGQALRQGVTVVPAILARLPGPLRATREQLISGAIRPHAAGPLFRALVALRRTALAFVAVHSANVDRDARLYATLLLGELAYTESATALLPRVFDPEEDVRTAALAAARNLRTSPAVFGALISQVERIVRAGNEQPMRRLRAAHTLGELASLTSVPTLLAAIESGSADLKRTAHDALVKLTLQDVGPDASAWERFWRQHGHEDRAHWVIDALTSEREDIRARAVTELSGVVPFDLKELGAMAPGERAALQGRVRAWWRDGLGAERSRA